MARLRNRLTKATFWNDPELLRWPRDKRTTYKGLWALAEDSGCLEDDPFEWKLILWPSPMDADITVELLTQWRDELVEAGKLIPYESDGKPYLFAANFHQHEKPRNPQSPDLPLPPWVRYEAREVKRSDGRTNQVNSYHVGTEPIPGPHGAATESPVLSCPVLSSPVLSSPKEEEPPLVELALSEIPASESTREDYARTITRHLPRLSDQTIQQTIYELAEWQPKKPRAKLHLTLNTWLAKKPPDREPETDAAPPGLRTYTAADVPDYWRKP